MGAMSQLAAEKEQEINILHADYLEAFQDLMTCQEQFPLSHRSIEEMRELHHLEALCSVAKAKYERANERRHIV